MTDRDDQTLARLLKLAGSSTPIAADTEERVYAAVRKEWEASTTKPDNDRVYRNVRREWHRTSARSRVRRWAMPLAIAASAVLAVAVIMQPPPPVSSNVPLGKIAKNADPGSRMFGAGQSVFAGDTVTTGSSGGISITLADGESIRLDRETAIDFVAHNRLRLIDGRVYADTGNFVYRDKTLIIETDSGEVTDVGTQFSVDARGGSLDVAVREGRVDVQRDGQESVAVAGERLILEPGQPALLKEIAPHDDYWGWVSALAPVYDIENRSLLDFLRWAARETGRELVFEDDELRMSAMKTDLHGSVEDFLPDDAITAVLATTRFKYRVTDDRIVITRN